MAKTTGRVVIKKNPKDILDTSQKVFDKHTSLGTKSPLRILEDVDWSVTGPKIKPALDAHNLAEELKRQMEEQYSLRDAAMPEITKALKQSVNLLKSSFGDTPKKLAQWEIDVDDSPKAKKKKD